MYLRSPLPSLPLNSPESLPYSLPVFLGLTARRDPAGSESASTDCLQAGLEADAGAEELADPALHGARVGAQVADGGAIGQAARKQPEQGALVVAVAIA
jgi:hypothetical protein